MGCVSSNLLNHNDEFPQLGASAIGHHIVSLTSTTYGLLNLDPPQTPTIPPTRFTLDSIFSSPLREPKPLWSEPEVINSWELMAGLDTDSFRFSPLPLCKPFTTKDSTFDKENSNLNRNQFNLQKESSVSVKSDSVKPLLERFERICPPNGENRVVIYTTTLRGVRNTFEACNAVRAAFEGFGVQICERDVSMDRGFREELRELLKGKEEKESILPPRVFVKGSYIGGVEELLRMVEEGLLGKLLEGLPRKKAGSVCGGCGDMRFLPCDKCNGSSKKVVVMMKEEMGQKKQGRMVVMRCTNCNENGLVICPICT
ncbi:uncharacterized protein At5g39865-like [Neltuma alba]|uniref:uncharacterized protein At5g39865-like n=1 Tax=Neltuma alba TaxID=207710 RepID=UPI0010A57613|nr:uncharacterized protein At5g39865-like [Prosopis alba]XP_028805375.1 uncharacterized protein At5g39865-like [Prosopis alba]